MKAFKIYLFVPVLVVLGLGTLVGFQNCANDVGFEKAPSADFEENEGGGIGGDGSGTGDSEIIIQINEVPGDRTQDDEEAVIDYEVIYPNDPNTGSNPGTDPGNNPGDNTDDNNGDDTDGNTGDNTGDNPGSGTVKCELNGAPIVCKPKDRIPIIDAPLGPNTFTIIVTAPDGSTEVETITWDVYRSVIAMSQDIEVTVQSDQVDVIINVDNSGSMKAEQESMASRIRDFITPFAGLDYHIAITTTSPIGNDVIWKPSLNYVDGKFVPLNESNTFCIKSSEQSQAEAQTLIRNNVVRSLVLLNDDGTVFQESNGKTRPEGNGWERGIYTTYRAFERDVSNQQGDNSCMRPNVDKHVILISDENETMQYLVPGSDVPRDMPDFNKSVGQNLVNYVSDQYGDDTIFKFHSIIVVPGTDEGRQCLQGNGGRYGTKYAELSNLTGGYIGSVCASNYATQLGQIGEQISNSSLAYKLDCVAVPNDGNMGRVVIKGTNKEVSEDYGFFGDKVEFGGYLGEGQYTIEYFCYSNN